MIKYDFAQSCVLIGAFVSSRHKNRQIFPNKDPIYEFHIFFFFLIVAHNVVSTGPISKKMMFRFNLDGLTNRRKSQKIPLNHS